MGPMLANSRGPVWRYWLPDTAMPRPRLQTASHRLNNPGQAPPSQMSCRLLKHPELTACVHVPSVFRPHPIPHTGRQSSLLPLQKMRVGTAETEGNIIGLLQVQTRLLNVKAR